VALSVGRMAGLVLIVEDEPEISGVLAAYAARDGFRTVVAASARRAIEVHHQARPDLVLLDVRLPDGDGFDVLRELRREHDTPVIMVSARDEDLDKLLGLRLGADDYIVKPFSPSEVIARVHAVLRRARATAAPAQPPLRVGVVEIDLMASMVQVNGVPLSLTATEYRLLAHLARSPRRTFTREQLLQAVAPASQALERVVDAHLVNLRRKLAAAGAPGIITTVRGLGFRLDPGAERP